MGRSEHEEKRVPMQGDGSWYLSRSRWTERTQVPGTITWEEHVEIWQAYDKKWHCNQSAEKVAERGGFSFFEAKDLLGHELRTWKPRS